METVSYIVRDQCGQLQHSSSQKSQRINGLVRLNFFMVVESPHGLVAANCFVINKWKVRLEAKLQEKEMSFRSLDPVPAVPILNCAGIFEVADPEVVILVLS
ncbi:hypothetical protein DAPPUDRAFT_102273 [Daphnia pulex]|uniref:Uncharacterized protein n=1 Tax=Daphnia pulex TaxID=6669 RepID=E9GFX3_DAPPU|nr:hypothetical protein DAPPUDRAFT_102273 [Daphnia pulex]|eukprot:EFX81714.1 hypothetical protein DAPPUDRAFT_102273 [Daphnia pulex]